MLNARVYIHYGCNFSKLKLEGEWSLFMNDWARILLPNVNFPSILNEGLTIDMRTLCPI